jgi:hypothetical protein
LRAGWLFRLFNASSNGLHTTLPGQVKSAVALIIGEVHA